MYKYISKLEIFSDSLRQELNSHEIFKVSGVPFARYGADGKDTFNINCEYVFGIDFFVVNALMKSIEPDTNIDLDPRFIGTYPILIGHDVNTNDEYIFVVRKKLDFLISYNGVPINYD